ncbi:MAG: DUF4199 domain-containing protein [Rhodothermales bacterium]|nr:DUF4199 domain-containing protein [Rhodothermales bacterium]MBO6781506.1 DUF4199 domain-containing protein [Rhodothermales bacterium]
MKRIALIYGSFSGVIIIGSAMLSASLAGDTHLAGLEWLGYLVMTVALSMVYMGVKRYRDNELGGVIRFGTAFLMGLGITAIASVIYVLLWEIYLVLTDYAFIEQYTTSIIAGLEADGVVGAALEAEVRNMEEMKATYADPLYRIPITFLEIFPVGLLVTIISAVLLRHPKSRG